MKPNDFDFHEIELSRLAEEWVQQDRYYMKYALQLAEARAEYERARTALEVVEAEIDRDVRSSPSKFGLEKATEKAIERVIVLQVRWANARENLIERKHDLDILDAAVSALDHRKKALESLSIMDHRNYWSEPKVPPEVKEEYKRAERDQAFGKSKR